MGFGAGGIIKGSLAAWIQSLIGNVVPGSIFALLQAFGGLWWAWFDKLSSLTSMIMIVSEVQFETNCNLWKDVLMGGWG